MRLNEYIPTVHMKSYDRRHHFDDDDSFFGFLCGAIRLVSLIFDVSLLKEQAKI